MSFVIGLYLQSTKKDIQAINGDGIGNAWNNWSCSNKWKRTSPFHDRFEYDLYVDNSSFILDLTIMLTTFKTIILGGLPTNDPLFSSSSYIFLVMDLIHPKFSICT